MLQPGLFGVSAVFWVPGFFRFFGVLMFSQVFYKEEKQPFFVFFVILVFNLQKQSLMLRLHYPNLSIIE